MICSTSQYIATNRDVQNHCKCCVGLPGSKLAFQMTMFLIGVNDHCEQAL